jgi:hypothetical protein
MQNPATRGVLYGVTELRPRLAIGRNSARIVVGCAGYETGPRTFQMPRDSGRGLPAAAVVWLWVFILTLSGLFSCGTWLFISAGREPWKR